MDHAQTNDQQQFGMVPNSVDVLTYEQLERSTCPCRDTSATAPRRSAATEYKQLKRETSQMKMMENNIKWSMNRDEQRQAKHKKIADAAEIVNRRQQEAEEMKAQTVERTKVSREKAQVDSKDRQQFEREVKSVVHNEHLRRVKVYR